MQTRKDLYQAHRLMQQRLGMALLQGEPDIPESPMRRHNIATFCGILLAVLVLAVFGIWGLVSPGNATKLTDPGQLLVDEESGATYVYSQEDRRLLPVANYVSARLLLDSADVTVRNVSAASLADFPRGPLVGISGAPSSLPPKDKLVKGPWSVCVTEGADASGGTRPYVSLVGGTAIGGTPVAKSAMVVDDGRQKWVLLGNQRMRVNTHGVSALNAQPRQVPPAWLNAIPTGPDFAAPDVPSRGRKVGAIGTATAAVGQVFTVPAVAQGPDRYYVLLADGLAPITLTQATLLLEDPISKRAYGRQIVRPITIDAATANASPSKKGVPNSGLPPVMPEVVSPGPTAALCAVYADTRTGSNKATLTFGGSVRIPPPKTAGNPEFFDQVLLPPGGGALVGLVPAEGQIGSISNYFLVSDQGRKHALPPAQVEKLGYAAGDVGPVPAHIVNLIPEGPALDPTAARSPLAVGQ